MDGARCCRSVLVLFSCIFVRIAYADYAGYSTDIECYQRVAVGKRLNSTEVSSNQALATVRQCEQECERSTCYAFAFGVSTGGNGTCELATEMPKAEAVSDIDYDLFYKNAKCLNRTSCFKRLAVGRSLIDRYVKRELRCDSLRACEEACALESAFVCEGFNFKFDRVGFESKCQLTNIPSTKLSLTSDFNADADFDFFEKDRNAPRKCHFPWHVYRPPWGGGEPPNRPWGRPDYAFGHGYGGHPNGIPDSYDAPNFDRGPPPNLDRGPPPNLDRGPPPNFEPPYGRPPPPDQPDFNPNQISPPRWPPDRFADKGFDFGGGQHAWLGNGFGLPDECFVRIRTGFRLDRGVILASIHVPALYDCEYECTNQRKFTCNTFSFRYSSVPGGDNCQLSDKIYGVLDSYTDILPDRDYDIYDRNPNGRQGCQPKRFWGSDCFERVKTGLKLKDAMIKFSIKVSSLSECEAACINMPYFTCRAFSFRYGPPTIGDREDNCLLTDWTTSDGNMNINKDFAIDPECELYYRGSYGHGCEIGRYPEYSPIGGFERPRPPPPSGGYRPGGYLPPDSPGDNFIPSRPGYYPPDKPDIIPPKPGPAYLPTPDDGYQRPPPREPGSNAYLPPPPRPDGDGFPIKPPGGNAYLPPADRPNGYLPPDKPGNGQLPPPRPGPAYLPIPPEKPDRAYLPSRGRYPPDYRKGDDFYRGGNYYPISKPGGNRYLPPSPNENTVFGVKGYSPRPSDEMCYIRSSTPARLLPGAVKVAMWCPSESQCKEECTRAREKTRFRCATISYRDGQCELSDIEQRDLRLGYDYLQDKEFWMFTWDFGTPNCYNPPPPGRPPLLTDLNAYADRGVAETWAHFTVNGQPCRAGTVCTMNPEVGVWSCPVDNGDWDYCCRSGHHCGYSEGYNYPWCYVGSADRDQWRPCSDSYYPYAHSGKKLHWPVAYLHREGPPNVTLDHKPSIVDRFLNSLDKLAGGGRGNGTMETVTLPAEPRKESDSDKESAMDKLWMWGKAQFNNLTSSAEPPSTDSSPSSTILSTAASTTDSPTTTAAPTTVAES
ncbi:PAN domain [Nesidiocoris tenuis]|uniref:PAN domain n=1 Tax=Nesidiocoris tenuis TaxID=355587 RepID=A0ABN7B0F1_9HEMI|nr:PAN domain [Nesidiocoris tenuis]